MNKPTITILDDCIKVDMLGRTAKLEYAVPIADLNALVNIFPWVETNRFNILKPLDEQTNLGGLREVFEWLMLVDKHDESYPYSDDIRAYRVGHAMAEQVKALRKAAEDAVGDGIDELIYKDRGYTELTYPQLADIPTKQPNSVTLIHRLMRDVTSHTTMQVASNKVRECVMSLLTHITSLPDASVYLTNNVPINHKVRNKMIKAYQRRGILDTQLSNAAAVTAEQMTLYRNLGVAVKHYKAVKETLGFTSCIHDDLLQRMLSFEQGTEFSNVDVQISNYKVRIHQHAGVNQTPVDITLITNGDV